MRTLVIITVLFSFLAYASPVSAGSHVMDVEHIQQMPELPRGCEVTSLAMLLKSAGIEEADKLKLAKEVKKVPFQEGGYRGNPHKGFVGNMYTFQKSGYGVYHEPIAELAERYLPNQINDLTGGSITDVYQAVDSGTPVWVIINSRYRALPESQFSYWKTRDGMVKITYREHAAVVTGYDSNYVYVNDPLHHTKNRKVSRYHFEQAWKQMGSQAITYFKKEPVALNINGEAVGEEGLAYKLNHHVFVPIRVLAEETGASLIYDGKQKAATLTQGETKVVIHTDDGKISVNNSYVDLGAPAQVMNQQTYVPVRLFEHLLDTAVRWDAEAATVHINTN